MKAAMAIGVLALAAVGCGEITSEGAPDAGRGVGGMIDNGGVGGHVSGVGGTPGTGGAPVVTGTGGAAPSYPFCAPTETLAVDTGVCQKLDPGGTYSNRTKDGHVCAICDPYPNPPVTNLPCLYTNHLCVQACGECN